MTSHERGARGSDQTLPIRGFFFINDECEGRRNAQRVQGFRGR
jgi:hypothetical protein